jgi:hypothetical protein
MRRIVFGCLGAITGFLEGWPLAACWAALTGNLVMSAARYEERREFIEFAVWLIVGASTLLGGVLPAWVASRRHASPRRDRMPERLTRR